jgi:hypothetical protein
MTRLKSTNAETGIFNTEGWSRQSVGDEVGVSVEMVLIRIPGKG